MWKGPSGRYFTIKDGRAVPARAPGAGGDGGKDYSQVAPNRPTRPEERDPDARSLPKQPWRHPPEPKGKKGGGPAVRGTGEQSQTVLGDRAEEITAELNLRSILPEGKRSFTAKEVAEKGSSIDREYDHSGKLCEIKMCRTTATEYRMKAKAKEKEGKLRYAELSQGEIMTVIPVWDVDTGEIHVYWHEGLTGSDVRTGEKGGWNYMGKVKV